jgi:hypothetical protein
MSSGQRCTCDSCDFEFWSGHSHHEGASNLVCTNCDARYCLPTKSIWGAESDEMIELNTVTYEPRKQRARKKYLPMVTRVRKPSGQYILAVSSGAPHFWITYDGVAELSCMTCRSVGLIVQDVDSGDACPRCKTGKIECVKAFY